MPLNEIIRVKRGVTAAAALDLAEALGTTSKLWMNQQATWDLDVKAKRRDRGTRGTRIRGWRAGHREVGRCCRA